MPPKNESGTLMTSAHGHDTTRKMSPRCTQSDQLCPNSSGGMTASSTAMPTTAGV